MKLKCTDGKVREFLICRPKTIPTRFGLVEIGGLLEAECVQCGHPFGFHDTYLLKPKFIEHVCKNESTMIAK